MGQLLFRPTILPSRPILLVENDFPLNEYFSVDKKIFQSNSAAPFAIFFLKKSRLCHLLYNMAMVINLTIMIF